MFEIHESAKENFDKKVKDLIGLVSPQPDDRKKSIPPSDFVVVANIQRDELLSDIEEAITDYKGNTVGRFFSHCEIRYGLVGDDYKKVIQLAEAIQKIQAFKLKVSRLFIEKRIFRWLQYNFQNILIDSSFINFLIEDAKKEVKEQTVYIPLAHTSVEVPFEFCGVIIRNITKVMIDDFRKVYENISDKKQKEGAEIFINKLSKDIQGYAAIEIKVYCEPSYVPEIVIAKSNQITDLLGVYSEAVLLPEIKCPTKIKGTENIKQYTLIRLFEDNSFNVEYNIIDKSSSRLVFLDKKYLEMNAKCGFFIISDLVVKESLSDFEHAILNMAFLYSKAAFTSEPMEKLIYMLSALESTLLKNENEPIQQNLAERMAIFIGKDLSERKAIVKNVRYVYGLRSRYLHHGNTFNELDELSKFFLNVWYFFVHLIANNSRFKTKEEFLNRIDDQKLG